MTGWRGGAARVALAAAVCAALTGCAGSVPDPPSPRSGTPSTAARPSGAAIPRTTSSPRQSTAATAPSPRPESAPDTLTLAFAGDVHFQREARPLLDDPTHALESLRPTLGAADLSMVNLETAITTRGTPIPGKPYTFRAPETAIDALVSAGVDVVGMANNHAVDFGDVGLEDTLAARAHSPVPIVGVGRNIADAFGQRIVTVKGVRIAVIASTQLPEQTAQLHAATATRAGVATNLDPTALRRAVRRDAAAADLVVVLMHWGLDYYPCAETGQQRTARLLAADGADIIVGGHAHRVQGGGWLKNAYVGYGLGNFVWYRNDGLNGHTGVLTLTVDAKRARAQGHSGQAPLVTKAEWTPMLIGDDAVPRVVSPSARAPLQAEWQRGTACSGLAPEPRTSAH